MALPYLFAAVTSATGAQLDANFQATGVLGTINCTVSGTNTIVMTPGGNTPTISAYANYLRFSGIVAVTNTGTVTINAAGIGALPGYKDSSSGPTALVAGDLFAGNSFVAIYDSTLNTGSGGFHVTAFSAGGAGTVTSVGTGTGLTGGPIVGSGTVSLASIASHRLLANMTGGSAAPIANTLTNIFDTVIGTGAGSMIVRGSDWNTPISMGNGFQFFYAGASVPAWGLSKTLAIAAAGSVQADATPLTTMYNEVTSVPAGTGVIMTNPTASGTGCRYTIFNRGANTLHVYPPVGGSIDGGSVNAAITVASPGKTTIVGLSDTVFYTES